MHVSRLQMAVPLAILATLALLLAAIAPVLAAPSGGTGGSRPVLADHVTDCNLTVDGSGDLTFEGAVLAGAELAAVDALLAANADLAAAIDLAAEADVDACINLELLVDGEVITANIDADISVCSATVTINGNGSVDIGDANVDAELLDARLIAALQLAADAAADADTEACVVVTVTDNDVDADVEVDAVVTLCATLIVDANGDTTINGTLLESDQFINADSGVTDFTTAVEVGVRITSTIEIDGDIFVLVEAFDLEGCGDAAPPPPPPGTTGPTGMVMVMKHLCDASIQSEADFRAVEARAATNPTTPMGVPTLGSTAETVLACPVIVQPGDGQTPGTIASGSAHFNFTVEDSEGTTQVLTEDTTFSGDNGFDTPVEDFACETDIGYDADRSGGELDADVCLDFSSYAFADVVEGDVTVVETNAPAGARFGTVRLSPPEISDDAAIGLSFTSEGVITFDSSADGDEMVTLHVYNFQAAVAPTARPTPAASELPDAAVDPTGLTGSNGVAILFGIMALASISFLGYRTVAVRRTR